MEIAGAAATVEIAANTVLITAINGSISSIDSQLSGLYGRETALSSASHYIGRSLGLIDTSNNLTNSGNINVVSTVNTIGNLFMTDGNIGINNTSPSERLHVDGSIVGSRFLVTGITRATTITTGSTSGETITTASIIFPTTYLEFTHNNTIGNIYSVNKAGNFPKSTKFK